jgi:NAD(P)H-dependent FMN reductase
VSKSPKVLILVGSAHESEETYARKLAALAFTAVERSAGEPTLHELCDHPLPKFDRGVVLREGMPEGVRDLRAAFVAHRGLLLVVPAYTPRIAGFLEADLVNAIAWASICEAPDAKLGSFDGKVAALVCVSPGASAFRGMHFMKRMLQDIRVRDLPDPLIVPRWREAFLPDGGLLKDHQDALDQLAASLVLACADLDERERGTPPD